MLQIRPEQLQLLARETLAGRLVMHARQVAPQVCEAISASHLRAVIGHCLARCDHYRISRDYDILRYLNLMLVFGVSFDQDEPWAAQALAHGNPDARVELLMDLALQAQRPAPVPEPDAEADPASDAEADVDQPPNLNLDPESDIP